MLKNWVLQRLTRLESLCAFFLIISFFRPWIQIGNTGFAPYDLAHKLKALHAALNLLAGQKPVQDPPFYLAYLLYLFPLACIWVLFWSVKRLSKRIWPVVIVLAMPWTTLLVGTYRFGVSAMESMTFTAMGVLIVTVLMLLGAMGVIEVPTWWRSRDNDRESRF